MLIIYLIAISCWLLQLERGIFDFLSFLKLFSRLKKKSIPACVYRKQLFILIPVLREQEIIEDTISNILQVSGGYFKVNIVVITSSREQKENNRLTTEQLIKKSIKFGKLRAWQKRIFIFRESRKTGNMATQLNYAIQRLKNIYGENILYILYNADSIISSKTFQELSILIKGGISRFAFQQPCAFVRDLDIGSNNFTNALSIYQTWYCLGHESRLIRRYAKQIVGQKRGSKLGVIVGHGSGMTLGLNLKNGGYPEDLVTEDLTFGFMLSANNVPIISLPALEIADVPNNFSIFLKQKSVWFWNFLSYPKCYSESVLRGSSKSRSLLLLIQGIGAGAYWFFDTFFIIVPVVTGIIYKVPSFVAISVICFIFFYILPQFVLFKKLPKVLIKQGFGEFASRINRVSFSKLLPSLILIILTNSVGPWVTSWQLLKYKFGGTLPPKYKTGD